MNFKASISYFALALLLWACNSEFDINPDFEKKLVVRSVFKAGDTIKLELFRNVSIADSLGGDYEYRNDYSMPNATVLLYEDDQPVDTMLIKRYKWQYVSKWIAQENRKYSVAISHKGYSTVYASTVVPAAVPIKSVPYAVSVDSMNMKLQINVGLPTLNINYYIIKMYTGSHSMSKKRRSFYNIDPVFGDKLEFDFNSLSINSDVEKVNKVDISDELGNKDALSYLCLLPLRSEISAHAVNDINVSDTIVVELYSTPYDLYMYNQTTTQYLKAQSSNAEPINMYSNVENGLGIFVGYSLYRHTFYYK